jgi:hypothetical protein
VYGVWVWACMHNQCGGGAVHVEGACLLAHSQWEHCVAAVWMVVSELPCSSHMIPDQMWACFLSKQGRYVGDQEDIRKRILGVAVSAHNNVFLVRCVSAHNTVFLVRFVSAHNTVFLVRCVSEYLLVYVAKHVSYMSCSVLTTVFVCSTQNQTK